MKNSKIDNHVMHFLNLAGYGSYKKEEIEDLYYDTKANLFNNSPRVVMITAIQTAVNVILTLKANKVL